MESTKGLRIQNMAKMAPGIWFRREIDDPGEEEAICVRVKGDLLAGDTVWLAVAVATGREAWIKDRATIDGVVLEKPDLDALSADGDEITMDELRFGDWFRYVDRSDRGVCVYFSANSGGFVRVVSLGSGEVVFSAWKKPGEKRDTRVIRVKKPDFTAIKNAPGADSSGIDAERLARRAAKQ